MTLWHSSSNKLDQRSFLFGSLIVLIDETQEGSQLVFLGVNVDWDPSVVGALFRRMGNLKLHMQHRCVL